MLIPHRSVKVQFITSVYKKKSFHLITNWVFGRILSKKFFKIPLCVGTINKSLSFYWFVGSINSHIERENLTSLISTKVLNFIHHFNRDYLQETYKSRSSYSHSRLLRYSYKASPARLAFSHESLIENQAGIYLEIS